MKKGKQLVEELRDMIEAIPPQFQKKNGDKDDKDGKGEAPKSDGGKGGSDGVIKALRDTDYKDKDAFFKMVQLLKGLAVNSEKDETAKKFMSAVSNALTTAAKSVLGEEVEIDEASMKKAPKQRGTLILHEGDFNKGSVMNWRALLEEFNIPSGEGGDWNEPEEVELKIAGVKYE